MSEFTLSPLLAKAQTGSLVVETGSLAGQRFALPPAPGALLLGRERICNVRFDPDRERLVGRTHARIEVREEGVFLVDLNSANGTFREGGQPVRGSVPLLSGMRFQLGGEGGPWLSVELPLPGEPVAVHAPPRLPEAQTLVTRIEPVAEHVRPAVLIRPATVPSVPSIQSHSAPLPMIPSAAGRTGASPRGDNHLAASVGSSAVDSQAAAYRSAYYRQIVVIALLLLAACGLGVLLGISGTAPSPAGQEMPTP